MDIEKYKNETTTEILRRYAMDEHDIELSETHKEMWNWVLFADEMMQQSYGRPTIATMMSKRFSMSERTAYNYIKMSQEIFGGHRAPNASFVNALLFDKIQDALRRYKNTGKQEIEILKVFQKYEAELSRNQILTPEVPKIIMLITDPAELGLPEVNIEKLRREYEKRNTENIQDAEIVD
jgi:uncharacterized protein YktB (UPF0637 family)